MGSVSTWIRSYAMACRCNISPTEPAESSHTCCSKSTLFMRKFSLSRKSLQHSRTAATDHLNIPGLPRLQRKGPDERKAASLVGTLKACLRACDRLNREMPELC